MERAKRFSILLAAVGQVGVYRNVKIGTSYFGKLILTGTVNGMDIIVFTEAQNGDVTSVKPQDGEAIMVIEVESRCDTPFLGG